MIEEEKKSTKKFYGRIRFVEHPVQHPGFFRETSDGRGIWEIATEPHVAIRLKRIFPRVLASRTGVISIVDTPEIAYELRWILSRWPHKIDKLSANYLLNRRNQYVTTNKTVAEILAGKREISLIKEPTLPPRNYQLESDAIVGALGRLLVVDDIGLGKTLTGLLRLCNPDALPGVVVTLNGLLLDQWLNELNKFLPWLNGHIINKGQPYDPTQRRSSKGILPDVYIINYHKLAGWSDTLAGVAKTVIFDEIQALRRSDSQKYIAAGRIADQAKYKIGLTATPVVNYGIEIYNIVNILANGLLGTRSEFEREWEVSSKGEIKNPKALGAYLRDQGIMIRHRRGDPNVNRELPPAQIEPFHIDADLDILDSLSGDAIELAKLIVSRNVTQQERFTASGQFDMKMREITGISKAPYAAEFLHMLLETSEESIVAFGYHHAVYDILAERLAPWNPVFYTGRESLAEKRAGWKAFKAKESRLLIMSVRSGQGLDGLQEHSSVCCFVELDWAWGIIEQSIGRLNRDGQLRGTLAYMLLCNYGTDPYMAEVLNIKRSEGHSIRDPDLELFKKNPQTYYAKIHAEALLKSKGIAVL